MNNNEMHNEKSENTKRKFWISFMGNSPVASLNCIWLAYERDNFLPDKLIFFATPTTQKQLESYLPIFKEFFRGVTENVDLSEDFIEIIPISETLDLLALTKLVEDKVMRCKEEGVVAIDVTPGRKIMSIASLEAATKSEADKIYYLHLLEETYRNLFAPEIPCVLQILYVIDKRGNTKLLRCEKNAVSK